jgi:hypothetical protein
MSGSFIPEEISMLVSSDPALGASQINALGSKFQIQLDGEGLKLPKDAVNINVAVDEAQIWFNTPNIFIGVNNILTINGPNSADAPTTFTVVIDKGLYNPSSLNKAVTIQLESLNAKTTTGPLITIQGNSSTGKSEILFNYYNVNVDFTVSGSPRLLLGYESLVYSSPTSPDSLLVPTASPNFAKYNTIANYLISSDLVSKGIRINNKHNQVIAQIPIPSTTSVGSQIIYVPFNASKTDGQDLQGVTRTVLRFQLTNEKLELIDTNGEYWSARIVIHYMRPMIIARPI